MHLVNIRTLELEEFIEGQIPPYAILSHRWGAEELNFKEVSKKRTDRKKRGYRKLVEACRIAADYDVQHLWIDTCCIDKRSSAELSEAINSMFSWYENAKVCLAYLEDVELGPDFEESFRCSVWFTRSWTLQELLAPGQVDFFSGTWNYITSKAVGADLVTAVTGIPKEALTKESKLSKFDIAQRMSWASTRRATRTEDIAYSLMGIFDINMPLLYGEGQKAFLRLMEEIIRRATELSFLLWGFNSHSHRLLADTPLDFHDCGKLKSLGLYDQQVDLMHSGIGIETMLQRCDVNVYGIRLTTSASAEHVLLLREHWRHNNFYRIGISTSSDRPIPAWTRSRKLTLLRFSQEENLTGAIKSSESFRDMEYGFCFRTDELCAIQTPKSPYCS